MLTALKGISDNQSRLHLQLARTDAFLSHYLFGYNQKGNQENGHHITVFRMEMPLVRPESKRSRGWSRSRYFQAGVGVGDGVI